MSDPFRVLVVDGSVVNRQFLSEALSAIHNVEVAAVAATGRIALARLDQKPVDLVLIDVQLEEEGGLKTIKEIRSRFPDIGLIPLADVDTSGAEMAIRALELGALDFLPKPEHGSGPAGVSEFRARLEPIIRAYQGLRHVQVAKRLTKGRAGKSKPSARTAAAAKAETRLETPAPKAAPQKAAAKSAPPSRIDVVVIGVSTGGPKALSEVIPKLSGDLGVPVLLVQHMPPIFTEALAGNLNKKSALEVREAVSGEKVKKNTVYVAPGGRHMTVVTTSGGSGRKTEAVIELNDDPPVNSCRPAADVLFKTASDVFGERVLAVVMTGMGNDGAGGVRYMKSKGGYCLTQNEETCVVYGMPRVVDEAGLSDEQAPLELMAERIMGIVKNPKG